MPITIPQGQGVTLDSVKATLTEPVFKNAKLDEIAGKIYWFFGFAHAIETQGKDGKPGETLYLKTSALDQWRNDTLGSADYTKLWQGERKFTTKLLVDAVKTHQNEKSLDNYTASDARVFETLLKKIDANVFIDTKKLNYNAKDFKTCSKQSLLESVDLSQVTKGKEQIETVLKALKRPLNPSEAQMVVLPENKVTIVPEEKKKAEAQEIESKKEEPKPPISFDIKKLTIDKKGSPIKGLEVDKEINAETFKKFGNDKHSQAVQIRHLAGLKGHEDSYRLIAKMDPELFGIFLIRDTLCETKLQNEDSLDKAIFDKMADVKQDPGAKELLKNILNSALQEDSIKNVEGYKKRVNNFIKLLDSTAKTFDELEKMNK